MEPAQRLQQPGYIPARRSATPVDEDANAHVSGGNTTLRTCPLWASRLVWLSCSGVATREDAAWENSTSGPVRHPEIMKDHSSSAGSSSADIAIDRAKRRILKTGLSPQAR
ncbi:uncharacterized protein An08g10890 [Aspergillus niger]|uniref:Contig An08c0280, genomic contig n=2 Tax=Aspergillus niger TaxID=5061 RepID=A2QSI9_ASPNC|nr:uncharacterized protein An08g10890 [Aspergillus niger]CAK45761.1 unnamed protein product [Aspergillus niger]